MVLLPIVERELRVAARRPVTYRARFWASVGAMLIVAWRLATLAHSNTPASRMGEQLFVTLSALALGYCLWIGAQATADCLSAEKREGTLGLLFLTDLEGLDVVLGKLAASSITALYGLLAMLPMLAVPLLMGGVSGAQFARMAVLLLNTMFVSLAAGVLISAWSQHERVAMMGTVLVLLGVTAGPLALAYWLGPRPPFADHLSWLLPAIILSPLYPFAYALGSVDWLIGPLFGRTLGPLKEASFWASVGAGHLLGWLCLLYAGRAVRRVWEERGSAAWLERWRGWWLRWAYGNAEQRVRLRRELLETNPFLWLASRERRKPLYAWAFLGGVWAIWIGAYFLHGDIVFDRFMLTCMLLITHAFFKIWITSEACARLVEEQRSGSLELLLSSPLDAGQILRGQVLALRRQFLQPAVVLLLFDGLLLWVLRERFISDTTYSARQLAVVFGAVMIAFLADLAALVWVGMWQGVVARNTNRAIARSVLWVLLLPWAAFVAWQVTNWNPRIPDAFVRAVGAWLLFGLVADAAFGFWARLRLGWVFRRVASEGRPAAAGSRLFSRRAGEAGSTLGSGRSG
jgi:ABC-type transport system involved in multi-copper enzyme maturation permease subunit